jgi:hypothetical protein
MIPLANHEPQRSVIDAIAAVRPDAESSLQTVIQRTPIRSIARSLWSKVRVEHALDSTVSAAWLEANGRFVRIG